jgi:hypothetical protein
VSRRCCWLFGVALAGLLGATVQAQPITYRGFVEGRGVAFPQDTPHDPRNLLADALARVELFARPWSWLGLAVGSDARANSYEQVADSWDVDIRDRDVRRPRLAIRRMTATINRGPFTVDVGKQFIRWGKADILIPTDRFAPRDYLNVIDPEFLAIRALRVVFERDSRTLDVVWQPWFTPSRLPLLNQRWTAAPAGVLLVRREDEAAIPTRSQIGVRWGETRGSYEYSASFYDGYNHLPNIETPALPVPLDPALVQMPVMVEISPRYPTLRMYGGDVAVPTPWFTAKGEIGYFTSSTASTDEYTLYVLQLERQTGEWVFVGGYAGELVTAPAAGRTFAPDRGTAKTFLGRASYTIDVNRSAAIEGAIRQDGRGSYVKGEYSRARGSHWRATLSGAWLRGEPDDFLGQYRQNSHLSLGIRYSF